MSGVWRIFNVEYIETNKNSTTWLTNKCTNTYQKPVCLYAWCARFIFAVVAVTVALKISLLIVVVDHGLMYCK